MSTVHRDLEEDWWVGLGDTYIGRLIHMGHDGEIEGKVVREIIYFWWV